STLTELLFGGEKIGPGNRPLAAQRGTSYGDPDEPGDPGTDMPGVSQISRYIFGKDSAAGRQAEADARREQAERRIEGQRAAQAGRGGRYVTAQRQAQRQAEQDILSGTHPALVGAGGGFTEFSNSDGETGHGLPPSAIEAMGCAWTER